MIQQELWNMVQSQMPAVIELPGDYRNEDGILICGKCGNPKSGYPKELMNGQREVTCGCMCDDRKAAAEKHNQSVRDAESHLMELYNMGVADLPHHRFEKIPYDQYDYPAKKLLNYTMQFPQMKHRGLLLHGGHGTGKSFYLECVAHSLIYDQGKFAWLTSLDQLVEAYSDKTKQDLIRRYVRCADLLIIDDYIMDRSTEKNAYRIIDERYKHCKPIIVATTTSLADFIGDRTWQRTNERIKEVCESINMTAENRRKLLAAKNAEETRKMINPLEVNQWA